MPAQAKQGRYTINTSTPCPKCGAKCIRAGELTYTRRGGLKWTGPYIEFECGLMVVAPGAQGGAACSPEFWNTCANSSPNGKPVVDIAKGDYEIREGKPIEPERPRILIFQTTGGWGTSSSTSTFF